MSNVADIKGTGIDAASIEEQARRELAEEQSKKAKEALKIKLRSLASAQQVVKNIEREIEDLKASLSDGSFAG